MNNVVQQENTNFKDLRLAHLHNKFWTPNSVEVPDSIVILNEDFVDISNVIRIPEQYMHFKVYWATKDISGVVCVPGQWNYCYIDGKFYHLTKGDSNGFVEGIEEEWFYYNVTYDDWQNDWMKNKVYIKGTIDLTGDQDLVRENLHQIPPLLENVNNRRFLNGIRIKQDDRPETTSLKLPETLSENLKAKTPFTIWEKIYIDKYLKEWGERVKANPELGIPVEEKLVIPYLFRMSKGGNWKYTILKALQYHADSGFVVHDVTHGNEGNESSQAGKFRNLLQNLLHTDNLYAVASRSNRTYVHARAVNPAVYVDEVDLSECNDITLLDGTTLNKRYTLDRPAPKFNLQKFVDWICRRQDWSYSLKEKMKQIFQEEFVKYFGKILHSSSYEDNKVFRDVELEKIERDVVDLADTRGPTKNPEWLTGADTRLVSGHHHKNFIWDNLNYDGARVVSTVDLSKVTDNIKNEFKVKYRKGIESTINNPDIPSLISDKIKGIAGGLQRNLNDRLSAFIYLPNEYKMKSKDDTSDYLDFSYNYNDKDCEGGALTPDYDRNTHVLSFMNRKESQIKSTGNYLIYNQKNSRHRERKDEQNKPVPIYPIIFSEITKETPEDAVLDWKKPSQDFMRVYKYLGKNNSHRRNSDGSWDYLYRSYPTPLRDAGAEILSRGYAFMLLQGRPNEQSSILELRHHIGSSGTTVTDNCKTTTNYSYAQRPECVYTDDKREWRRFHTEMTFPLKTDTFDIIAKLREFDDIPDNFLRGEVVNTNIKKGKIKAYTRSYVGSPKSDGTRNNETPGAYRLTKEEEKKIPPNTVVSIYICLRQSGSPEGDAAFDRLASNAYYTKYQKQGHKRMEELLYWLCKYFFLTRGEVGGEYGAIPDWIKVYGAPNYPPNGDGRSQIGLSGMKPHKGRGYVAWTRFFAPAMYHEKGFRIMDNSCNLFPLTDPRGNPSKDFIMAEIPNTYYNSGDYYSHYTYRKHTSAVDMNTLIAFYYANAFPRIRDTAGQTPPNLNTAFRLYGNTSNLKDENPQISAIADAAEANEKRYRVQLLTLKASGDNTRGAGGGYGADILNYEGQQYLMNGNTLILDNFIRNAKTYKSVRLDNPTSLPNRFYDGDKTQSFTKFEDEIPPFMVHYLNPEDVLCQLHNWQKNPNVKNDQDRLALYTEKVHEVFRATTEMMETWGVFMKFEGTKWYANMQLNTRDMVWDFELFCGESSIFKERGQDKWNFVNHLENDIDILINTRNELNVYGNKFTLKSRNHTTEDVLDLGLYVKPLKDQKQTIAAQWYGVTMRLNDQDVIEEIIETPKELNAYAGYNYFDKERMIRQLGLQNAEFMYRKQMIEFQKQENKINDDYEKDMQWYAWKYGVVGGAMDMVVGLGDMAVGALEAIGSFAGIRAPATFKGRLSNEAGTKGYGTKEGGFNTPYARGKNAVTRPHMEVFDVTTHAPGNGKEKKYHVMMGNPDGLANRRLGHGTVQGASTFAKGLKTVAEGGMNIGRAYDHGYAADPRRQKMFELTNKKLFAEGDMVNARHEHDRASIIREIGELSANVAFPQLNSALVYKEHNKQRNLNDVHIVQYYPSGKLAEYLKKYYKEFGYQLMVRDFECNGIDSIKTHLRYQFVYENNYNDITIKSMINIRAMNGVKVIPWVQ